MTDKPKPAGTAAASTAKPTGTSTPNAKPNPDARLKWWQSFNTLAYEVAAAVPLVYPNLKPLIPVKQQAAFDNAITNLQNVAAQLQHSISHQVIAALEKHPPQEPPVPNIDLPDVPVWKPGAPSNQGQFKLLLDALIPFVRTVADKLGPKSDMGLAVLELFTSAEAVLTQLNSAGTPAAN
jgi:hypothetical protein